MNVSCEGGGSWGRDIAESTADNLWVCNAPGDLNSAVGKVPTPGTREEGETATAHVSKPALFPRRGESGSAMRGRARPTAG